MDSCNKLNRLKTPTNINNLEIGNISSFDEFKQLCNELLQYFENDTSIFQISTKKITYKQTELMVKINSYNELIKIENLLSELIETNSLLAKVGLNKEYLSKKKVFESQYSEVWKHCPTIL